MAGGNRSLLAFWAGGAGTRPLGVRSLLAFWTGGAAGITPGQGSVRSLLAFWGGGAAAPRTAVTPGVSEWYGGGGAGGWAGEPEDQRMARRRRRDRDDIELFALAAQFLIEEG